MPQVYTVSNANSAFKTTLEVVSNVGEEITAAESLSIGSNKSFKEVLNYHMVIENPQQRLLRNSKRSFNLPGAIARFIWMMAGNNRLADIEFYWGKIISPFTDDGITIPGSSYRARMFNSSPGLNQIDAIIDRLQKDPSSRRAAVAIYQPVDAVRESRDIPCTFGLFFHVREGKLMSTIIMRSNNAYILLPYNIFEFSLLAEVIACEIKVPLGSMNYNAMSMHFYDKDYENVAEVLAAKETEEELIFPVMPQEPSPMQEIQKLIRLEAIVRHKSAGLNKDNIDEWLKPTITIDRDEVHLDEYWRQFYYLLLYYIVSKKTNDKEALRKVADKIKEPYKQYLSPGDLATTAGTQGVQQDLFGNTVGNPNYFASTQYSARLKSLDKLCADYNQQEEGAKVINLDKYIKLREELVGDVQSLAARNQSPEISQDVFRRALDKVE
jgi:thymidylate synthase